MWILELLPIWVFHGMIVAGLVGYVASIFLVAMPTVKLYKSFIRVISTIAIIFGTWFSGISTGIAINETKWQERVKAAEEQARKAELESTRLLDALRIEQEKKENVRTQKGKTIIRYIDSWITQEITKEVSGPERVRVEKIIEYIENCPVPKEFLDAHNAAAKGEGIKK